MLTIDLLHAIISIVLLGKSWLKWGKNIDGQTNKKLDKNKHTSNSIGDNDPIFIAGAARLLGVSIETLRNYDANGTLQSRRTAAGRRTYTRAQLQNFKNNRSLTTSEAAALLGISASKLRKLESSQQIQVPRDAKNRRQYSTQLLKHITQVLQDTPTTPTRSPDSGANPPHIPDTPQVSLLPALNRKSSSTKLLSVSPIAIILLGRGRLSQQLGGQLGRYRRCLHCHHFQ